MGNISKAGTALFMSVAAVLLISCGSTESDGKEEKALSPVSEELKADVAAESKAAKKTEDESKITVNADNEAFGGRNVYLRGEMNDYGIQKPYQLRRFEKDRYCTLAALRADWSPYRFKFADEAWTKGSNFGFAEPPAIIREGSAAVLLNPYSRFEELRYEPAEDGIYRFCIQFEKGQPYAVVERLENGKLTTMDEIIRRESEALFGQTAL